MLYDGKCSIYNNRPLACRLHFSFDTRGPDVCVPDPEINPAGFEVHVDLLNALPVLQHAPYQPENPRILGPFPLFVVAMVDKKKEDVMLLSRLAAQYHRRAAREAKEFAESTPGIIPPSVTNGEE